MTPTYSPSPVINSAESIALLYLLHSVPILPSSNPINDFPIRQGSYALSFNRERDLVSTLAFLANTKDDPSHIPALCIKEIQNPSSISVLLAVNKTKWEDGNEFLQELKQGFEEIFTALSAMSEAKNNVQNIEDRIFTAIVSMCSHRILCRLRFVAKNRGAPKQPIKSVLEEAISSLKQLKDKELGGHLSTARSFTEKAKDVIKLADAWVKHQISTRLKDLIEGIHRLRQVGDLQVLLDKIPNRTMCPSSRRNLVNIVSKVSRYREAARFLYRAAKKYHTIRQMKVLPVNLPKEVFSRVPADQYTPRLASTISRISAGHQRPNLGHLCRLLKTTDQQLHDQFASRTTKTLREAKIHAEIQLAFYCELNPSELPPRIVCSSKDACYLCNAFILMHGKMHMPRYHGRLYPGWRLPLVPDLLSMAQSFNSVLDNQVWNSLRTLLSRCKKTAYPDPNESTLLTLPVSTSTLRTLALSEAIREKTKHGQGLSAGEMAASQDYLVLTDTQALKLSSEDVRSTGSVFDIEATATAAQDDVETEPLNRVASQLVSENYCTSQAPPPSGTTDHSSRSAQASRSSDSVAVDYKSTVYTAGPLEIHLEYTINPTLVPSRGASGILGHDIRWLPVQEAKELLKHKAASVIDVEALQDETSHTLDDQNCLFVMARGAVVKMRFSADFDQRRNH